MKRGPKPCLVESPLTTWMDECADQMVCPTRSEITDEAQAIAEKETSVQNPALPCKSGKTWWMSQGLLDSSPPWVSMCG